MIRVDRGYRGIQVTDMETGGDRGIQGQRKTG